MERYVKRGNEDDVYDDDDQEEEEYEDDESGQEMDEAAEKFLTGLSEKVDIIEDNSNTALFFLKQHRNIIFALAVGCILLGIMAAYSFMNIDAYQIQVENAVRMANIAMTINSAGENCTREDIINGNSRCFG